MKKKTATIIATLALTASMATAAFAAYPSDIVSSLTGKSVDQVYSERQTGKTYGQIAQENGVFDQFKTEVLRNKKEILDQRVADGVLTKEQADTYQ